MPQHTAHIIDSDGHSGKLKLKKCREHEAAGRCKRRFDGVFVFPEHPQMTRAIPEMVPELPIRDWRDSSDYRPADSGQRGFARYPIFGLAGLQETARRLAQ